MATPTPVASRVLWTIIAKVVALKNGALIIERALTGFTPET